MVVFLVSLIPLPLCIFLNSQKWMLQPSIILVVGVVTLSLLILGPYLAIRRMKNPDFFLYGRSKPSSVQYNLFYRDNVVPRSPSPISALGRDLANYNKVALIINF